MRSARFFERLLPVALFCLAPLAAQKTWIVDGANGPGTDFTDLPPALAAAVDGDHVVLRKGDYAAGSTGKALTLIGEPGARILVDTLSEPFEITGLPAGRTLRIVGLEFVPELMFIHTCPLIHVHGSRGSVHLERVRASSIFYVALHVQGPAWCTATDCHFDNAVFVEDSFFAAERCRFDGQDMLRGSPSWGLGLYRSTADLAYCDLEGSHVMGHAPATPAIKATQSRVTVRGDASNSIAKGTFLGIPANDAGAIEADASSVFVIDPAIVIVGDIRGTTNVSRPRLAALSGQDARLGRPLSIQLRSPQNDLWVLFGAAATRPVPVAPFGGLALDPASLFVIGSGIQGPSELASASLPIPAVPALRGFVLGLQALAGPFPGLELSNPAVRVLQ